MIIYKNGSLLNSTVDVICQQVNCQGKMGSGLAREISLWFPEVKKAYFAFCENKKPEDLLGKVCFVTINVKNPTNKESEKVIFANLFGQLSYGRENTVYTDYLALENAISILYHFCSFNELSVALPVNIGCGLANGDWNIVKKIIEKYFLHTEVFCELWKI